MEIEGFVKKTDLPLRKFLQAEILICECMRQKKHAIVQIVPNDRFEVHLKFLQMALNVPWEIGIAG